LEEANGASLLNLEFKSLNDPLFEDLLSRDGKFVEMFLLVQKLL
jgi:hypothetical protein